MPPGFWTLIRSWDTYCKCSAFSTGTFPLPFSLDVLSPSRGLPPAPSISPTHWDGCTVWLTSFMGLLASEFRCRGGVKPEGLARCCLFVGWLSYWKQRYILRCILLTSFPEEKEGGCKTSVFASLFCHWAQCPWLLPSQYLHLASTHIAQ
jgi:hypothetical protein